MVFTITIFLGIIICWSGFMFAMFRSHMTQFHWLEVKRNRQNTMATYCRQMENVLECDWFHLSHIFNLQKNVFSFFAAVAVTTDLLFSDCFSVVSLFIQIVCYLPACLSAFFFFCFLSPLFPMTHCLKLAFFFPSVVRPFFHIASQFVYSTLNCKVISFLLSDVCMTFVFVSAHSIPLFKTRKKNTRWQRHC